MHNSAYDAYTVYAECKRLTAFINHIAMLFRNVFNEFELLPLLLFNRSTAVLVYELQLLDHWLRLLKIESVNLDTIQIEATASNLNYESNSNFIQFVFIVYQSKYSFTDIFEIHKRRSRELV